ncbi:MAG TPA: TolC family protein [Ignavibacteriaceae bacterium]|nr:TolC family protein [Ignavibacteriaceae bacterium]
MRIFLSFLCIVYFTGFSSAQNLLTLDQAINIALQRNPDLLKSTNGILTYESGIKASYGALLPSLGASGRWEWVRNKGVEQTFTDPSTGAKFTSSSGTTETRRYNAGIGTQWVLFDGLANIASVSQNQNDLEAARMSLARLKQSVVFQTISYYYDIINTQKLLAFKEDDVKWNERNLETITERNKLGAVTLADVYAQQVRTGNAELEVVRTQNNLEVAKSNLLYYLGLDVTTDYVFSDSLTEGDLQKLEQNISSDYKNVSELMEQALDTRYDYKSARLTLESAYDGVTIARSGHFPSLVNDASFSSGSNTFKDLFKSKTYSVGLTLQIPIFSGFSVENRVEIAQVSAMNQEVTVNELERDIKRNLQQTFLDLQAAQKALDVGKRNVLAATENQKIEQEKYNIGSGTLLNVLIANSEYTNALTNYINAQFAYVVLSEQLKYQIGTLDYSKYEQ